MNGKIKLQLEKAVEQFAQSVTAAFNIQVFQKQIFQVG